MDGLGRRMPFTFGAFLLGSLSIIGLPPMGGSWSKWYLVLGAAEAGQLVMMAVLMVSSLLTIAYLMPVVGARLLPAAARRRSTAHGHGEAASARRRSCACCRRCLTGIGCVVLFFFADDIYQLLTGMRDAMSDDERSTGSTIRGTSTRSSTGLWSSVCVLLVALADLVLHTSTTLHFGFEDWFGFYGFYGFVGLLVASCLAAKQLRKILMRGRGLL